VDQAYIAYLEWLVEEGYKKRKWFDKEEAEAEAKKKKNIN